MRELAAGEVDDGHQMPVRTKSASPSDGRLDLGVDRFGRAVGQAQPDAVDDAVQMISHGRAQSLEGREPATPRPGHPAFEPRFGVMAVLGGFEEAAQRFLEPPGTGGLQIRVRQPVHVVDLGSVPAAMILERTPALAFETGLALDLKAADLFDRLVGPVSYTHLTLPTKA